MIEKGDWVRINGYGATFEGEVKDIRGDIAEVDVPWFKASLITTRVDNLRITTRPQTGLKR